MDSDLQTQHSMPAFADVPMSQANSRAPLQAKGQLLTVKPQLQTQIPSQITLTHRKHTYLLF